jgi:ketosteroid isomerase-like protein
MRMINRSLATLLLGCMAVVSLADDAAVRKALQARYEQFSAAFKRKDVKAVLALGTPDFTWKLADGRVLNARASEKAMQEQLGEVKAVHSMTTRIDKLQVEGLTATVWTTGTVQATVAGEAGKTHKLVSTGKSKDVWVNKGGKWLIKRVEDFSQSMTIDGRPVNPDGSPKK